VKILKELTRIRNTNCKYCKECGKLLSNNDNTFCSSECVCRHNTKLVQSDEYRQRRVENRDKYIKHIYCKACGNDLGERYPRRIGKDGTPHYIKYCNTTCAWNDNEFR
jgi:hypothetical protein